MGVQSLDKDFLQYWMRLSIVSIEQYNAEIDEAMKRMDAGV
jgi:hypothetical protein